MCTIEKTQNMSTNVEKKEGLGYNTKVWKRKNSE